MNSESAWCEVRLDDQDEVIKHVCVEIYIVYRLVYRKAMLFIIEYSFKSILGCSLGA